MKSVLVSLALLFVSTSVQAGECVGGRCLVKSKEVVKKVVKKLPVRRCRCCK